MDPRNLTPAEARAWCEKLAASIILVERNPEDQQDKEFKRDITQALHRLAGGPAAAARFIAAARREMDADQAKTGSGSGRLPEDQQ